MCTSTSRLDVNIDVDIDIEFGIDVSQSYLLKQRGKFQTTENSKRLKNREDSSNLDENFTESIVTTRTKI